MQHTNHYRGVPFNRLLFTKLDETIGVGGAFDLMRKTGVPFSYFSIGQRVPEDLEVARPERLAELLLGESGRMMKHRSERERDHRKGQTMHGSGNDLTTVAS